MTITIPVEGLRCPLCMSDLAVEVSLNGAEITAACLAESSILHSAYASLPWMQEAYQRLVEGLAEDATFRDYARGLVSTLPVGSISTEGWTDLRIEAEAQDYQLAREAAYAATEDAWREAQIEKWDAEARENGQPTYSEIEQMREEAMR